MVENLCESKLLVSLYFVEGALDSTESSLPTICFLNVLLCTTGAKLLLPAPPEPDPVLSSSKVGKSKLSYTASKNEFNQSIKSLIINP